MPTRLVLLCAGATAAVRDPRFARGDEPLDAGGRAKLRGPAAHGPGAGRCFVAPTTAARETAALLGIAADEATALRDQDHGAWSGRRLADLPPAALADWIAAPGRGAPGGEDMAAVQARVGAWLDALGEGSVMGITHGAVIRAAIAHVLGVPAGATLAIDIAPLSTLLLSRHDRWRMQELRRRE